MDILWIIESHQRFGRQPATGLVQESWASSHIRHHLLQFGGNLHLQFTRLCAGAVRFKVLSRCVSHESSNAFHGVWQHQSWLAVPDKTLYCKVKENLSGGAFFSKLNLYVASVWLKVFISLEHIVKKDCSARTRLILIEAIRPLQHWDMFPFVSYGLKEAGSMCAGCPVTISKHDNILFQKG